MLIADGLALYDSTVILEFQEEHAPEPPLYPRTPAARARCRQLELEADELFLAPVYTMIRRHYAEARGEPADPSERPQVEAAFSEHCRRLSRQLAGSEFLRGQFGVADIAHFLVACFGQGFGLHIPDELSNLRGWFQRVASRPVVAGDLAVMRLTPRVYRKVGKPPRLIRRVTTCKSR